MLKLHFYKLSMLSGMLCSPHHIAAPGTPTLQTFLSSHPRVTINSLKEQPIKASIIVTGKNLKELIKIKQTCREASYLFAGGGIILNYQKRKLRFGSKCYEEAIK